jgi:hypothetical protein
MKDILAKLEEVSGGQLNADESDIKFTEEDTNE